MQRDSVSRDKAISRSEYRQTEGIVLRADTQTTASTLSLTHTHTHIHTNVTEDRDGQEARIARPKDECAS